LLQMREAAAGRARQQFAAPLRRRRSISLNFSNLIHAPSGDAIAELRTAFGPLI
jgi:hypothetical protein